MNWTSFKVGVLLKGSKSWTYNSLRFEHESEAQAYADDLKRRWTLVRDVAVHNSEEPSNATFPVPDSTYHIPRPDRLKFEPRPTDIDWANHMVSRINEGGILIYPSTELVYVMFHSRKALVLMNPSQLIFIDSFVVHLRTIETFNKIGWTVEEAG